jgi:hypothetical protein
MSTPRILRKRFTRVSVGSVKSSPQTSLVIQDDALAYLENNKNFETEQDYAVVYPKPLYVIRGMVYGTAINSSGERTGFTMPVSVFRQLELKELS